MQCTNFRSSCILIVHTCDLVPEIAHLKCALNSITTACVIVCMSLYMYMCVCVYVGMYACVYVCMCVCVHVCTWGIYVYSLQVFYFPDAKLVVVQPLWLMSDITGKFYSPSSYPPPIIICDDFGFASRSHVIEVLAKDSPVGGEDALDIAVRLGMCHVTEDGEQVMILPAQAESRTSLHWEKANPDQHIKYTGRRLYCKSGIPVSAALMPTIQMSLVNSFANRTRKFPVWQGGVRVSLPWYVNTDTLVEIPHGQLALNIITRGPDQRSVTSQQEIVWDHISALPRQQSPGSDMSTAFVDDGRLPSSDLLRQRDQQGDLNATMEFLASERLHAQFVMPDEREPDTRKYHPYAVSASCCNAGQ